MEEGVPGNTTRRHAVMGMWRFSVEPGALYPSRNPAGPGFVTGQATHAGMVMKIHRKPGIRLMQEALGSDDAP